jgi:UDP-galactopyranose mutase
MRGRINVVVGAGLTGATIARRLDSLGEEVIVLEASDHVGGKCEDGFEQDEVTVAPHYVQKHGPHIFHTHKRELWNFVNSITEFVPTTFMSMTRTEIGYLPIPVNLFTVSLVRQFIHGEFVPLLIPGPGNDDVERILKSTRAQQEPAGSFARVCRERVGDDIYDFAFKHYTEAWWGQPCQEIPGAIAERIPVRRNFDVRYHDSRDIYVGVPSGGFSAMIRKMLQGIPVHFDYPATLGLVLSDFPGARIFCTADASVFLDGVGSLPYRGFYPVHHRLVLQNPGFQQILDSRPSKGEAGSRFYCSQNLFSTDLNQTAIRGPRIVSKMIPYPDVLTGENQYAAYPVPHTCKELADLFELRKRDLARKDVFFAGRLGSYKYLDMDDAIQEGLDIVETALTPLP